MEDKTGLDRRQFLAVSGSVLLGGCQTLEKSNPQLSIEITLTESLAEQAEAKIDDRSHPADVMEYFLGNSLQSLLPENTDLEVRYNDLEPDIEDETAGDAIESWVELSNPNHHSKLLITDEKYPSVGAAQTTSDPFESTCAVLGEGYDLLQLEEKDWEDKVLISEWNLIHETVYTPFKTVVAGIHEIGHNLGLEHEQGSFRQDNTTNQYETRDSVTASVMTAAYLDGIFEKKHVRYSDDIYWSPRFSQKAEEKFNELI